ncbi:MAG: acyl-CoA dehydrogenase family protein [Planctomycetaceae bacterium]|nr:acyl-CoA dehydrogenase family protein [Planctomycetaceae bacterium]
MDYELSKPQKLLQQSVRDFCQRECPPERVRKVMETETAMDEPLWRAMADQGWIGLHLPEEQGGLGLGLVELAVVAEELGRACMPGPFLSTTWAATLLSFVPRSEPVDRCLSQLIEGSSRGAVAFLEDDNDWNLTKPCVTAAKSAGHVTLNGSKQLVLDAPGADSIIVVAQGDAGMCLVLVDRATPGVTIEATPAIDATRRLSLVTFAGVTVPRSHILCDGAPAVAALARSLQVGAIVTCAELIGACQWLLDETVEYARTRKQFDRFIGSFQAVQLKCADMFLETESSRAAAYYAAWSATEGAVDAERAVSIAKLYCSEAARDVGNLAVQVHGGIGFTWEHDLHLYYKRNKANEFLFGDARHHREAIARLTIDAA